MGTRGFGRRRFMTGAAATSAGLLLWDPVRAAASSPAQATAITDPTGTTLEFSIGRPDSAGYVRLVEADPYPQVLREDLATVRSARDGRIPLASIVHLTDVHIVDGQSPARVEFTDRLPEDGPFGGAFRAQETMSTQVASAMVDRVNAVARGPVTGRVFDVAVSTGDNIDNQQHNELDWFLGVLDGGTITPNSGDASRYEGVQDDDIGLGYYNNYWHPGVPSGLNGPDNYKAEFGFPEYPGILDASIRPFTSSGLGMRWYSAYGNHDGLLQGNVPGVLPGNVRPLDVIATGSVKVVGPGTSLDPSDPVAVVNGLTSVLADPASASLGLVRVVTADDRRRAVSVEEWIQRHLDSPATPGPAGHGYTADMIESRRLYYSFPISDAVLGICMDTVNHGGYADGSIGAAQLAWLEQQLVGVSSSYLDGGGATVTTGAADRLVVLFSHHNMFTLENPFPDPFDPADARTGFADLRALLARFPNVIAWVNGHSHVNRINPVPDPSGQTGGFWEISTAAHIDWPQQARLIEIADNCDGTLSIFGTLIEHASDAQVDITDPASATAAQLASLSRELGANEPQVDVGALGAPIYRNVELLVRSPFTVCPVAATPPTPAAIGGSSGNAGTLPSTGGAGLVGLAAGATLATAAAVAARAAKVAEASADGDGSESAS